MNLHLPFEVPLIPASLHFEHRSFTAFEIASDTSSEAGRQLCGTVCGAALRFEATWRYDAANGWHRFQIAFAGEPEAAWGAFRQLALLDVDTGSTLLEAALGWHEYATEEGALRPTEEGGGRLPPNGYPVFGETFFLGIEHPLFCVERSGSRLRLCHHPLWEGGGVASEALIIGTCRSGEAVEAAFARYVEALRLPRPERAIVEINTFWTDAFEGGHYQTDLASYGAMARGWAHDVLGGEQGLVSHFMLDAGWQEVASLYRPQASNGGPGDEALGALGREINALGFELGLWMSLNGPIGVDIDWAAAQGYRVSDKGCGAGYSSMGGKVRYVCLTDERWEADLARRFEELIDNTPVAFFKGDWDNDASEDPARFPLSRTSEAQRREAIGNAMRRIYARMHARRPGVALRGAWWPSPWWLAHVDSTHLPNSGDMESSGFPSLSQRDSGVTCRDAVLWQVLNRTRTPFPVDALCPHEFAASRRNPVHDTPESWMNNLAMWVSRGSHYLQLYLAPYGLAGWKAWSLRTVLRWFRANEETLWKGRTEMLGGDPVSGAVYGFLHTAGEAAFLTLRNPLARPQAVPEWVPEGWVEVYPYHRRGARKGGFLASHEVVVLARHLPAPERPGVHTANGWREPVERPVPGLHRLPAPQAVCERLDAQTLKMQTVLPYTLEQAEVVLELWVEEPTTFRAALSRYADCVATFPVPVTQSHADDARGYSMTRLGVALPDARRVVLRFPIGTGGTAYALLKAEPGWPEITGAWVEGAAVLEPAPAREGVYPPAPEQVRQVVCEVERR